MGINLVLRGALASLILLASAAHAGNPAIADKTLVAWVSPDNLTQRGGGALTIEKPGGTFDSIVFAELTPAKWMAGSNFYQRTNRAQQNCAAETAPAATLVQIAIVYKGAQITIYRNGTQYDQYAAKGPEQFGDDAIVLMGMRHRDAKDAAKFFTGSIADARLYSAPLTAEQIASLKPGQQSEPAPLAWWDFTSGRPADRMGAFASSTLVGDARLADGRLWLDKAGAYLLAERTPPQRTANVVASVNNADSSARALREKLLSDPYRPGYHFVTPEGKCMPFDPNGAIFWKGRYHLFYIFQDSRGHNWGHASSTDLFHWRHHPTGLTAGMFSGNCFINKDGRPTICYHQVGQGNAMAVAIDDELNQWKKLDSNPITPKTTPGDKFDGKYRSWDPYGWLEGKTYYAIFGGARPAIAKSDTLEGPWSYVGDLMANPVQGVSINEDVSCADFFPLGNKRMLLCISHRMGCRYYLGEWKNEQFHPEVHQQMSWVDNSFFAPESLLDDQGRRIMWAWIFDHPKFGTRMDYGWSGTMSLPRVLSLGEDGTLRMDVPREIELLRYHPRQKTNIAIEADAEQPLDNIAGNSLELCVKFDPSDAKQYGVKVCRSADGREQTLVYYDAVEKKLKIDTTKSSDKDPGKTIEAGPLVLKDNEPLTLRIFVDKSVVEVFANGRQAVMRRIYPTGEDSVGVSLFSTGARAKATTLDAWDMMPSNPY